MQVLFAIFHITEGDFIKKQMKLDKAKMTKKQYYKTWIGRSFMLFLPTFTIISLLYRPL